MVDVKVYALFPMEHFANVKFRGFRGASHSGFDFTLAALPCMNLNDSISLFFIVSKEKVKYDPIISHLRRMLICYIYEVAKLDMEITLVLKKRPVVKPKEDTTYFQKRKLGKIKKADWSVVYQTRGGD